MITLRPLSSCNENLLSPKASSIKKMALHGYRIPFSYFVSHDDLLNIGRGVHNFDQKLKACALNPDPAELSKLRDDIINININYNYIKIFQDLLEKNINHKDWIIRSAFGCEDESESAFAGRFLSEPVLGASALGLFKSVLRVFSSFFDPDAFVNILSAGANPLRVNFGILVQQYIHGHVSGVGFSRDPHALDNFLHNKKELNGYSEWVEKGCEALTLGEATAGRCDFSSKAFFSSKLNFKDELIKAAKKFETMLHMPVDFEWTWDGEKLWWLQVRPITSEECRRVLNIKSGFDLSRDKVAERFPEIITPMGWSLIKNTLSNSLISFGSYVKIKFTNASRAAFFYKGLVYANKKYYCLHNCRPRLGFLLFIPVMIFGVFFRRAYIFQLFVFHNFILNFASSKILSDWNLVLENNLTQIRNFDGKYVDAASCLEKMALLRALGAEFFKTDIATHFLREAYNALIIKALSAQNISEEEALKVCSHFSNNITLQMHRDLEAIKNSAEKNTLLEEFIKKHGHLTNSWDVAQPTLGENKKALEDLVAQNSASKVQSSYKYNLPAITNQTLLKALRVTQDLARADEQQHFFAGLHVSKARELILSLGETWKTNNILFEADDIFYLTIEEAERFLQKPESALKFVARRRKKIWQRYADFELTKLTPHIKHKNSNIIKGLAASPGRATGTLFIAQSFGDLALMPEDAILYLRTPNPSYVPWFDRCKALLTEQGGILSHGFIAARELHVPAVSGIPIDALKHNNLVTVDGNSGKVFFH